MALAAIFANLSCSDFEASKKWFTTVFGRKPDIAPMSELVEWHHHDSAGFQLFDNAENAGRGVLTLIVSDVRDQHTRLAEAGLAPGEIEQADYTTIFRLRDPDGNLVVFAQPGKA